METTTEDYLKEFQKNQKYYRIKIKQDMVEDPVCKFKVCQTILIILSCFIIVLTSFRDKLKILIQRSIRCLYGYAPP